MVEPNVEQSLHLHLQMSKYVLFDGQNTRWTAVPVGSSCSYYLLSAKEEGNISMAKSCTNDDWKILRAQLITLEPKV